MFMQDTTTLKATHFKSSRSYIAFVQKRTHEVIIIDVAVPLKADQAKSQRYKDRAGEIIFPLCYWNTRDYCRTIFFLCKMPWAYPK